MDRASGLRLYNSSSVGVRILPLSTIFMKIYFSNLFNILAVTTPSLLQSHDLKKNTLAVDETYGESHGLNAVHPQ